MIQKLYALSAGECAPDNPDSPQHQEILLGGHLFASIIKEKMVDILDAVKLNFRKDMRMRPASVNFQDSKCAPTHLIPSLARKILEIILFKGFL